MDDDRRWKIRPPKGLAEYILRHCQNQNYLIFSEKTGTAVCTCCNEEFSMEQEGIYLTHSRGAELTTFCPRCGAEVIPKNVRYGRKSLRDEGRIIWFRKHGAATFMEMDKFIIDYQDPHPSIWTAPVQQIRLSANSQVRMDWQDGWWTPANWYNVGNIRVKHPKTSMCGESKEHTHIMRESLENVGTDLRYANLDPERFKDRWWDEYDTSQRLIAYISEFLKYPAIELLEKAGFETLVMNRASGARTRAMNIKGKDLRSILRLNKAEIRYLKERDPTTGDLENIRMVRKYWPAARIEDIEDICRAFPRYLRDETINLISKEAEWPKVLKMLLEEYRATGDAYTVQDYGDYLGWINKLGIRKDKRVIYPKNFGQAHDTVMEQYEEAKDSVVLEAFKTAETTITGMTEPFVLGNLMIRPAASPSELQKESKALNHCVRTYVDRVASGKTSILFIRKVEEPDTPWFTLELDCSGRVVQCRGDHNRTYPEEVGAFIDKWMKWREKARASA